VSGLWLFFAIVGTVTVALQQIILLQQIWWRRVCHLFISIAILALLIPILFGWRHSREIPVKDRNLGIVLWDSSASCDSLQKEKKAFKAQCESLGSVEFIEFSEGCLPPLGNGKPGGSTDLSTALDQVAKRAEELAPDWIWLVSDGGTTLPSQLPEVLQNTPLWLSAWKDLPQDPDVAIESCKTDPVWYSRSEAPLAINVTRSSPQAPNRVDLLVKMDGRLAATVVAEFKPNELRTQVQTQLKAEHLGSVVIEMSIAEGQGGSIAENDHLLHVNRILRDRVRILRVVGRPNWSAKFLRDQLVQREDVDLVDFHILRSMRDRVMATTEELALIPFPVDELFVDNIDSFDLIIWQNFDHENYPFFKEEFLRNIAKTVESGCGLWLWNGSMPWNLEEGPLSILAPVANRGDKALRVEGQWNCPAEEFMAPLFGSALRSLGPSSLNIFPGPLQKDARVVMALGDHPVMAIKSFGRGRVLQLCSDELWNWGFHPKKGLEDFYSTMIQRSLMWLQHDPAMERREFQLPSQIRGGELVEVELFEPLPQATTLVWKNLEGEILLNSEVPAGQMKFKVKTPKQNGVVQVGIEGRASQTVALHGLQGEYVGGDVLDQNIKSLEQLGFKQIDLHSEGPQTTVSTSLMRSDGQPWYAHWWFLGLFVSLLCGHWLILNRMLELR
jgi:hypothetical protein